MGNFIVSLALIALHLNGIFFDGKYFTDAAKFFEYAENGGYRQSLHRLEFANEDYLFYLPEEIKNYQDLVTILGVSHGQIKEIPDWIGDLKQLDNLHLENQRLTTIPATVGNLDKLEELNLSNNRLTAIPDEITNLKNLKRLYLSYNQLTKMPENMGQLNALEILDVSANRLPESEKLRLRQLLPEVRIYF